MDVRVRPWRKLSVKKLVLLNCSVGEDSWKSVGLQEIQPVHPKGDQSPECSLERLMLKLKLQCFGYLMQRADSWKDPDAGKDWRQEEKGTTEDWMASPTRWTWVWVNSRSWWRTGKPGRLWSMGSQRIGHNWATEPNRTEPIPVFRPGEFKFIYFILKPAH